MAISAKKQERVEEFKVTLPILKCKLLRRRNGGGGVECVLKNKPCDRA